MNTRHHLRYILSSALLIALFVTLSIVPARAAQLPGALPGQRPDTGSAATRDAWGMQGHDARRTGRSGAPGPLVPHLKWTHDIGAISDNDSPVVGADGTIFQTLDFAVQAITPTGTPAWGQTIFTAFGSRLAPALSPDGAMLYTTDDDDPSPLDAFIGAYSTLDGRAGGRDFVALAAGGSTNSGFSLALTRGGEPWAWGTNYYGQLGVGTLPDNASFSTKPVRVSGLSAVTAIAAGAEHSLALSGDGRVWSWGDNFYGQLGDGTTNGRALPGLVTALSDTVAIAAGANHSLAIIARRVWAWGNNEGGQIGNGRGGWWGDTEPSPVQVGALDNVVAVAGGYWHSLALKNDGTVWAWGDNSAGQLGTGTTTSSTTPVQVSGLNDVIMIAAGAGHSLAIRRDHTLWVWGSNDAGQLGIGSTADSKVPVQVPGLSGVIAVEGGGNCLCTPTSGSFSVAALQDGTVWAWGDNQYGQLGDGSTVNSNVPVRGLSNAIAVAAGDAHTLAIRSDGFVWGWGNNYSGQVGSGFQDPTYTTPFEVAEQRLRWRFPLENPQLTYSSLAVGDDGAIYLGTWDEGLIALNPDGTLHWRYDDPSICAVESPPAIDSQGNVYFNHNCVGLVALNTQGQLRWKHAEVGGSYGWFTPLIGPDGTIYVHDTVGPFSAFNPDGSVRWRRGDIEQAGYFHGLAISADGATIYSGTRGGKIYALDAATGATRWTSTVAPADEEFGGSPALSSNGILYIMGSGDRVYAVSAADGTLIWQYQLNNSAFYWGPQSPAIGPDGTLYIASSGHNGVWGKLYAFGPPDSCPAITLDPPALLDGVQWESYGLNLTAGGGAAPYTFVQTGGVRPRGLTLSTQGALTGAPVEAGNFNFTLSVADKNGCAASWTYALTVAPGTQRLVYLPLVVR